MKNTSESPETQEQAKPTTSRSRTTRQKTENATTVSQEQEKKPATPRRSSSSTRAHAQAEKVSTTPTSSTESTNKTSSAGASIAEAAAPSTKSTAARSTTARTRRADTSRQGIPSAEGASVPRQEAPSSSGEMGPRQRTTVSKSEAASRQAATAGEATSRQNTRGEGAPRQGAAVVRGEVAPHQGTSIGRGEQSARQPGTVRPAAAHPTRTGNSTGAPAYAPRQRPSGGAHGTSGVRPGTRHGGPATGSARPAQRSGPSRSGGRPGTQQRSHERRIAAVKEKPTGPVSIPPQIVVKDLAELLQTTPNEIIRGLIKHSIFANINEVVDYEKAAMVAQDLGFEPSLSEVTVAPAVQRRREGLVADTLLDAKYDGGLVTIPPVVTIMGHVDHGKTTLLDTIRKTKVAAGEAGGITQHIGAYQVEINGQKITFLDTPGHEAFTAMRARGAQVADIAIIVVAADDGVMPQTREAIDHAQAAKMPIIVALNKIDKEGTNPDRVKQQLAEIGVVIEEYGGDVVCVPVSARRGTGIDELLEMILLVAEVQDIKANPNRPATGVIIEAKLEKSSGATATVLVQQGTLKMGDTIVVGTMAGKVRAMINDRGKRVMKAPPSTPVSILGLPGVPQAGDRLEVVPDERTAKQIAAKVAEQRKNESMPLGQVSLDTLYMQMQEGKVKELNVILKCDVQGSAEAIKNALSKIGEENLKVRLIHEGIGNISETDVHLAAASGAIIIGFNVKADGAAQRMAQKEGVDIRYYNIIYKLTDDIQAALTGMLEPTLQEVIEGHAEVQQTFKAGKAIIAGCRVLDGKLTRSSQARVLRKEAKIYEGKVVSLRRGKDDVREVASGYECGILLEDFSDFEVGDVIEAFTQEKVRPGA